MDTLLLRIIIFQCLHAPPVNAGIAELPTNCLLMIQMLVCSPYLVAHLTHDRHRSRGNPQQATAQRTWCLHTRQAQSILTRWQAGNVGNELAR